MEKKIAIIVWLQLILVVMFCSCGNRMSQKEKTDSDTVQIQDIVSLKDAIEDEKTLLSPKIVSAEFEGVYDVLERDFQDLEDSLKNVLFNLTVSFCGDTIIINGNEKATFTRYTVATKDLYRQYSHCQRAIFKYFGKRTINVSDSIDYLSLSNYMNLDGFTYTFPGIIYERPYLIIPFEMNYMASFIVDVEPTENNRIMPERCSVGLIDDYCVSDFEKSDDYHLLSRDYNIKLSISFKDDASPIGDIILEYKNEQVRYDSIDYAGCVDVNAKLFTSVKKKRFYILLNCMYEYSNEYYIFIIDGNQPRYLSSYSHSILSDKMVEYHYSINVIDNCETLIISEIYDGKEKVIHKQKI